MKKVRDYLLVSDFFYIFAKRHIQMCNTCKGKGYVENEVILE